MTRRRPRHVWVVRANDLIVGVFSAEGPADDFAFRLNSQDRIDVAADRSKSIIRDRTHYTLSKHLLLDSEEPQP